MTRIVRIAKGYSRAAQSFLFARLTRANHDFHPGLLSYGSSYVTVTKPWCVVRAARETLIDAAAI